MNNRQIVLKKVCVHNLKSVDLTLDHGKLVVFTGVSGSGKSSMAFDTLYTEGQRRYLESLTQSAKRFLGDFSKPDAEHISGLSPTISIEQKTVGKNPRSTVGTLTEVYDYLRVLYARIGIPYCPISGEAVSSQSRETIIQSIQSLAVGKKILLLTPFARSKKAEFKEEFKELLRKGYTRVRVDGKLFNLNNEILLDGQLSHDVDIVTDRLVIKKENNSRIAESVTQSLEEGKGVCIILDADTAEEILYSQHAYSKKSKTSYSALEPHHFSFNSPHGMCQKCQGLGRTHTFDLDKIINKEFSIAQGCCSIATSYKTVRYGNIYDNLAKLYDFDLYTPWKELDNSAKEVFLRGTEKKWVRMRFVHPTHGSTWTDYVQWRGVLYEAYQKYTEAKSEHYRKKSESLMSDQICPECHGSRLKAYPAATQLGKHTIQQLTSLSIQDLLNFFKKLKLTPQQKLIAADLITELKRRLLFLLDVGLHYLTLDRTSPTLSGGEAQRVRLASQIGCGLVGVTYILDEPSIGLHTRDNRKLIHSLEKLRDRGNSVIVVEHDEETMLAADQIVDFGPNAGEHGGEIVFSGSLNNLLREKRSITADYLTGRQEIQVPKKRRGRSKEKLLLKGASLHNLKKVTLKLPLGRLIAITGVSGSGKSSLITETLYPLLTNQLHHGKMSVGPYKKLDGIEQINKVIGIDQSPIGKNPRSTPATYVKVLDHIRDLFTELPLSKMRGYLPGRFSFNVKEGSCTRCHGMGMVKVDMDFLEDAWINCSDCQGKRFDPETLSVYYKGKTIYDILEMSIEEALTFFEHIPPIVRKLHTLDEVGLGYLKLGQPSPELSGGESQRIKLAKELTRPATGRTLYILDEPTTGLHFHDVKQLLTVLQKLVEQGNTIVVIEHHLDVIKTADWVIDLGPEGGDAGGEIIGEGTPEKIAKLSTPTGITLKEVLEATPQERLKLLKKGYKKKPPISTQLPILIKGAHQHNLKQIDLEIPRGEISVFTGPSGAGKTSLAIDTLFAEGQRRYIDSLSAYARQFVKQMPRPFVEQIEGLSPAIAIEQKAHAWNPRSTVGTLTEVYDYLRLLYANAGIPHCPETGEQIESISKEYVVNRILKDFLNQKLQILSPIEIQRSQDFHSLCQKYLGQGFLRIYLNGKIYLLDSEIPFDKKQKNEIALVIDRIKSTPESKSRIAESLETATSICQSKILLLDETKKITYFNLAFTVVSTGKTYSEITPHTFSFNTHQGMCLSCQGIGTQFGAALEELPWIMEETAESALFQLWHRWVSISYKQTFAMLSQFIPLDIPIKKLTTHQRNILFYGSKKGTWNSLDGSLRFRWVGLNHVFVKAGPSARVSLKEEVLPLLKTVTCPSCQGTRLNPLARHVELNHVTISSLCKMSLQDTSQFICDLPKEILTNPLLEEVLPQIKHRLSFLCEVGLHYLSLNRTAPSLSGGEMQRIRLSKQLGNGLTGVIYILDEPTTGLHAKDTEKLCLALKHLRSLGNTLVIVEHDPAILKIADRIYDFGPAAGENGGEITAQGTLEEIQNNPNSLTGLYLSKKRLIPPFPIKRKQIELELSIVDATLHNLKNISVKFPLNQLSCITGVSGSGKSTLMQDIIYKGVKKGILPSTKVDLGYAQLLGNQVFDQVLYVNQDPIGLTSRSDVGTYTGITSVLRDFFTILPLSKIKGLEPKHFSHNHRKGMCSHCYGMGYQKIELHFLPAIKITCEKCEGLRLNSLSLEVRYKGKNLGEYMRSSLEEIATVYEVYPKIQKILKPLLEIGLGYLKLGQRMSTLSGGEAQRVKLSRSLQDSYFQHALYLLDEPTVGLHQVDIEKLLYVLHAIVNKGHTMILIEHNQNMIHNSNYVVELGPEAGDQGGEVVYTGKPR